jgi:tetratricopeptide (TPR) repeat protein
MPGDIHSYISEMLSAARSKSGGELLSFTVEQVLAGVGPRQAEVLRKVAVPRWVDASVLRSLRESDEGNERVLEKLREYSFVRDLGDGRLAYHDEVRKTFLEEWERVRPAELQQLHRRLYQHFSQRSTPPGSAARAMPLMPDSSLLSVVPMSAQADLLRREATYHLLWLDQERGLAELRASFDFLEDAHRLAEAELLLQMAGETPLGPRERRWVQYMRARVLQGSLSLEAANEQLEQLRARGDLEPELLAEVNRSQAELFAEIGQWARATELYRQSILYFARANNQRAAAETMLLLGEAYQGLGISTGSWYAPSSFANPLLRAMHGLWTWLSGLPFLIAILLLGAQNRLLPRAEHCARYQNWLLIRLYNTARTWYAQARDAFRRLGDAAGTLRAEQRLADILLLYGYAGEARAAIEGLLARPEARDPYRKAWLQRSLAECHLALGDVGSAQLLLKEALDVFKELGDVRREAVVRYLQGRAAMDAGDVETALQNYTVGLQRFSALRYAAARERILHELRAWKRQPSTTPAVRARVDALIAAQPEKRYVGRFIRSYLGLLQVASLIALPLAMLLMALASPTFILTRDESGIISSAIFFDPLRILGVVATLAPIYMAVYAAIATAVIYWLPISRIEREQPDVIVTSPDGIARYDNKGGLAFSFPWPSVGRWLALDRCLWDRPLALYSRTFLEDRDGLDLPIDGITGWYSELQTDLAQRLQAAGNSVQRRDLGYSLLRSPWGAAFILGGLLLLIVTSSNNGWLDLGGLVPPPIAGLIWFVALSGALMLVPLAYWIVGRPLQLQRTLLLSERWPTVLAVIGALPVLAYALTGGSIVRINALNFALFVWGVYVLAEALCAMFAPSNRPLRIGVVTAATLLALAIVAQPAYAHYRWLESYVARQQVQSGAEASAVSCGAATAITGSGVQAAQAYLILGDCAAETGNWLQAAQHYAQASRVAPEGSDERALAIYNLVVALSYTDNQGAYQDARRAYELLCATQSPGTQTICGQLNVQGGPRRQR